MFFATMPSPLMFQYNLHYDKQMVRVLPLLQNIPVLRTRYRAVHQLSAPWLPDMAVQMQSFLQTNNNHYTLSGYLYDLQKQHPNMDHILRY